MSMHTASVKLKGQPTALHYLGEANENWFLGVIGLAGFTVESITKKESVADEYAFGNAYLLVKESQMILVFPTEHVILYDDGTADVVADEIYKQRYEEL